jgi:hypothetical protein
MAMRARTMRPHAGAMGLQSHRMRSRALPTRLRIAAMSMRTAPM